MERVEKKKMPPTTATTAMRRLTRMIVVFWGRRIQAGARAWPDHVGAVVAEEDGLSARMA
jgi:hypothetical protein